MNRQLAIDFSAHTLCKADGPDTSMYAAFRVKEFSARHRALIWNALKAAGERGMTKDELSAATGLDHVAVARRMAERKGKLWIASDRTRPSRTGRAETVWVAI